MSKTIVFVAASPSTQSRSTHVARAVAAEAERAGLQVRFFSLTDFDPADVFFARSATPAVQRFVESVKSAAALVLSTPVYKAAYTGALKAIVDLIPPDALAGKPALGIATARLADHASGVDQAYLDLFGFFKARALDTLFVGDDELRLGTVDASLSEGARARVLDASRALVTAIDEEPE
jgi:FMN reductase